MPTDDGATAAKEGLRARPILAPESFNFNRQRTDPLLNDAQAAAQFDIVAGHVYGGGLADYPLARQRGKEVWMIEPSVAG